MPPLNSWQFMPVPPPTQPSVTGPVRRRIGRRVEVLGFVTWKPLMSLSQPS